MKKYFTLALALAFSFVLAFNSSAQKKENKGKIEEKKEQKGNANSNKHLAKDKGQNPNGNHANAQHGRDNQKAAGNSGNKSKGGNNNDHNSNKGRNHNGNGDANGHREHHDGIFAWIPETFKDRNQFRKNEKITLCHKFNNASEPAVTIKVSAHAVKAHMNHGDVSGECPAVNNSSYSANYLNRRTDYYNLLQSSQEEVLYSQSILDYALARLQNARLRVANLQKNNAPVAEVQRTQLVVTELQQNVSVLEQLIGVAANLVANKLMQ